MDISERAARQRREATEAALRRSQRQQDAAFFGGQGVTVNGANVQASTLGNGPVRQGQSVLLLRGPGQAQYDTPSRMEVYSQIPVLSKSYKFKTLSYTPDLKVWLGGDRPAIQIFASGFSSGAKAQLTNDKNSNVLSYLNSSVTPNKIAFLAIQDLSTPLTPLTVRERSVPVERGHNVWIDSAVAEPLVSSTQNIIYGTAPFAGFDSIFLESGFSQGGRNNNYALRFDEVAYLPLKDWAPYTADLALPGWTWVQTTLFDGVPRDPVNGFPPDQYTWQTLNHTEKIKGTRTYPVRIFTYDLSKSNSVEGAIGSWTLIKNTDIVGSMSRSQTFTTLDISKTVSSIDSNVLEVDVPIVGNQTLKYRDEISTTINSTLTDNRAVGTTANYNFSEIKTTVSSKREIPLTNILHGGDCALVVQSNVGRTTVTQTTETRNIASRSWTFLTRPTMQNEILFSTTEYLANGALVGQGPLGGWYSSSNASPTSQGENAPAASIYRVGNLTTGTPAAFQGSGTSMLYAYYDAPGAYGDNYTTANTYSEYTVTLQPSVANIYSAVINWNTNYNWSYNKSIVVQSTVTPQPKPNTYYFINKTEKLEFDYEETFIAPNLLPSIVSAPTGPGTLSISTTGSLNLFIVTARLQSSVTTATTTLNYANGPTPVVDTIATNTVYNSDPVSVVGTKAEIYFLLNDTITLWTGTVAAYTGDRSPAQPPASGSTGTGRTFTNTFNGPFPQTINVKNIGFNITTVETVPFCPFTLFNNTYTVIINPDFAIVPNFDSKYCNLVINDGNSLAKIYVANRQLYKAGQKNYVAVWEIMKESGKAKAYRRENVSSLTYANTGVAGEVIRAIQYGP